MRLPKGNDNLAGNIVNESVNNNMGVYTITIDMNLPG